MKKKLWTILFLGLSILVIGCSNSNVSNETSLNSSSENITIQSQNLDDISHKDNSIVKETNFITGTFLVGQDIPTGRYIFAGNGTLSIWNDETAVLNEIIDSSTKAAISSVTTDLYDGQKLEVTNLTSLKLAPDKIFSKELLSTGNWIVGRDIVPGNYICEPVSNEGLLEGKGNLLIYDGEILLVNENIDASGNDGVNYLTVELKEGQIISICNIPSLKFTKD